MDLVAADPAEYLDGDDVVDSTHPAVRARAVRLRAAHPGEVGYARAAFEYVRDDIRHSVDAGDPQVTITAAETLAAGVGLCFAKSHLLVALLRSRGIPAGLCYQRLTDDGTTWFLHGLVAVHLDGGWHRLDARGNRPGVDARFSLGEERLAWPVRPELGERDHPQVFARPNARVLAALRGTDDVLALCKGGGLPDDL